MVGILDNVIEKAKELAKRIINIDEIKKMEEFIAEEPIQENQESAKKEKGGWQ